MLREDGATFTTGLSRFADEADWSPQSTAKIFVKIEPESLGAVILAQLDTGAAWSMLDGELAEELSLLDGEGESLTISTRLGPFTGQLQRMRICIVADEGESLDVDATMWVCRNWKGTFLGYSGLLERIRFAIDPGRNAFHFGSF